jgi:phenylpyruvate tautomerase PptA (4-oxalocrotonate tautomerase family)
MQVRINKIDDLVSKLNSPDVSEKEKLALAEEITQAVDSTLQGEEAQVKKANFKVIQGWGSSMKVG